MNKHLITTAMAAMTAICATAAGNLTIQYLSPGNAMVRIDAEGEKYLLMPVQESAPMAHIRVLTDGKLDETLNINLADSKIDYYVPLRLDTRDGEKLLLDIRCDSNRSSIRDLQDAVWTHDLKLSDDFDTTNREKYRPLYHHTPEYGWMNDPNGMFWKDGVWNLYYQWNPYGSKWQNMSWGHSTSKDLVHWTAEDGVLYTDPLGMVFSGSAVVDKDNTAGFGEDAVIALFTSADAAQTQSLAYSTDNGKTFTRYAGNPVIAYERESRDPNMFWDEEHDNWVLVLASALDHEDLIFTSKNLKDWTLESKFGQGYGCQDGVWECPDLMKLPVEGTDKEKWVLIVNINPGGPFGGSGVQYFVGDFDGKTFKCDNGPEVTKWMDYGKDYYATVSFSNAPEGRHTVLGWMSNWQYANDVPTMQFRSANSLPRELSLFKAPDGELYLASRVSPEIDALRGKAIKCGTGKPGKKGKSYTLPTANDGICEIELDAELMNGSDLDITLSNSKGERVEMRIDAKNGTFSMDRRNSGLTDFSENFPAVTTAPTHNATGKYALRIFIDRSSIEAIATDGRYAMTNLVFPTEPYTTLTVAAPDGGANIEKMTIYPLIP